MAGKLRFLLPVGVFAVIVVFLFVGLYLDPREVPSPVGPMIRAALIVLLIELGVVFYIRRSRARATAPSGQTATARS